MKEEIKTMPPPVAVKKEETKAPIPVKIDDSKKVNDLVKIPPKVIDQKPKEESKQIPSK